MATSISIDKTARNIKIKIYRKNYAPHLLRINMTCIKNSIILITSYFKNMKMTTSGKRRQRMRKKATKIK